MRRKFIFLFVISVFVFAGKNCPSRLFSSLHQLSDTFSAGVELRGFYYNVDGENYNFFSLGSMLRWEPSESFFLESEFQLKRKRYTPCQIQSEDMSPFVLRTLYLSYTPESEAYTLQAGRQLISELNGLLLDDFFDAVYITAERGKFSFAAGGGLLALDAARETKHCQKCFFYEYKSCWKGFCEGKYGDFRVGFLRTEVRVSRVLSTSLMYLRADTQDPDLASHNLALGVKLNLPAKFRVFSEFALQRLDRDGRFAYGQDFQLIKSLRIRNFGTMLLKFHSLYATEEPLFTPLYGNITMGDRLHLSVRQGLTNGFSMKFIPSFARLLTLKTGLFHNRSFGTEYDVGLEISFDKKETRRLLLYYSRSFIGEETVNQVHVELRINI